MTPAPGFSVGLAYYTSLALSSDGTPYVAYMDGGNDGKVTIMRFQNPNLANLVSFDAVSFSESTVSIKWETSSEHDNVGFDIWRAKLENDELTDMTLVNEQIIPSKSMIDWTGASYSVEDAMVTKGNTYYYVLVDVNNAGESTLQCEDISVVSIGEPLQKTDVTEKVKSICEEYTKKTK